MKGKYYFFELDDCSLPGIASGTLKYLGTKTDFKKLLQGTGQETKGIRNTFKKFCAGNQTIKHNVAFSEQRFATPVKILKRKKILKGPSVYNHLNIWGFPYDVIIDATDLTVCLAKQRNNYYIYYRAIVKNPRMENELSDSGEKQFMQLGRVIWGFPGLLKYKEKEKVLYNTLMICESCYKTQEEAFKKYAKVQRGIEKRSKVKRRLEHLGSCIIDARSKRNLLFSQKQQIYFLRENNRKVYSIPKATIEELLFTEALAMVEYWIEQYIRSEREKRKDNIQKHLEDLNCQYAQLIDLRFENRIDEITFLKKQKILLESIKRVEKNKKEKFDFEKLNNLLFGLKKIKKRKLAVIKTVIKACYILEKETDNMRFKIVFLSMHNEIKTKFFV